MVSAEVIGSLLEGGTQYVPTARVMSLYAYIYHIFGTSLEERGLAPAGLEVDGNSLVVAEQVEELVCEVGSPQVDGHSLKLTNGSVVPEYHRREGSVVRSLSCEDL